MHNDASNHERDDKYNEYGHVLVQAQLQLILRSRSWQIKFGDFLKKSPIVKFNSLSYFLLIWYKSGKIIITTVHYTDCTYNLTLQY